MKKILFLVLALFSLAFNALAGKGEFKYSVFDVDAITGVYNVQTEYYTLEAIVNRKIAFGADADGYKIYLKLYAICTGQKLTSDYKVKITFEDGMSYTLSYAGLTITPNRVGENYYEGGKYEYSYYPSFFVTRELIEQFAKHKMTSIISLDRTITMPNVKFSSKAGVRHAENIRLAAEDFLKRVPNAGTSQSIPKGSDVVAPAIKNRGIAYKTDKVDDFTGERIIETEPIRVSQKASISFVVNDTKFAIVTNIAKDSRYNTEIGSRTKTMLVFDDLSSNKLETSSNVSLALEGEDATLFTIKSECTRQLIEKLAKKRLVKVRTEPDHETYMVLTAEMAENVRAAAADFLVKAKPLPGEVQGKDIANIKYPDYNLQGKYNEFEIDEETGVWLIQSENVNVSDNLGLSLSFSERKFNSYKYALDFAISDYEYFTSPHEKDVMLKLQDGNLIKLRSNEFVSSKQPYYNAPRYIASNNSYVDRSDIEKLAKSPVSKIRIVIEKYNGREHVDVNFECAVSESIASQFQQVAKEIIKAVPAR